jgi:hypothetical protein
MLKLAPLAIAGLSFSSRLERAPIGSVECSGSVPSPLGGASSANSSRAVFPPGFFFTARSPVTTKSASRVPHSVQRNSRVGMSVRRLSVMQFISTSHCELLREPFLIAGFFQKT